MLSCSQTTATDFRTIKTYRYDYGHADSSELSSEVNSISGITFLNNYDNLLTIYVACVVRS